MRLFFYFIPPFWEHVARQTAVLLDSIQQTRYFHICVWTQHPELRFFYSSISISLHSSHSTPLCSVTTKKVPRKIGMRNKVLTFSAKFGNKILNFKVPWKESPTFAGSIFPKIFLGKNPRKPTPRTLFPVTFFLIGLYSDIFPVFNSGIRDFLSCILAFTYIYSL